MTLATAQTKKQILIWIQAGQGNGCLFFEDFRFTTTLTIMCVIF